MRLGEGSGQLGVGRNRAKSLGEATGSRAREMGSQEVGRGSPGGGMEAADWLFRALGLWRGWVVVTQERGACRRGLLKKKRCHPGSSFCKRKSP